MCPERELFFGFFPVVLAEVQLMERMYLICPFTGGCWEPSAITVSVVTAAARGCKRTLDTAEGRWQATHLCPPARGVSRVTAMAIAQLALF